MTNATLLKALVALVPVTALFLYAIARISRQCTTWSALVLGGALCFAVVIFTHVAEALHLFPEMGWGEPHSVGHYLDLTSAVGGTALLVVACALQIVRRAPSETR